MNWDECKTAFYVDGSLRDIYVRNTNIDDWDKFLEFATFQSSSYFIDSEPSSLPRQASEVFGENGSRSHLLVIALGKVVLNCHFFAVDELELDVDPKQVTSARELETVIDVLIGIGKALDKDVILTDENMQTSEWFRYKSNTGTVTFKSA